MIRVGVDAWNLPHDRRGIGRYLREILRAWREDFAGRVEVTLIVPEWHTWTVRDRYRIHAGAPYRVVSRALHHRAPLDVLWFPWNGCSWSTFSLPAVATLHDASNFVVPGYAPQTQRIFRTAAERCVRLITDSEFSGHELARELNVPLERLVAIPLGVSPATPPDAAPSLDVAALEPYVLFVGTTERRKGIDLLVQAMERLSASHPSLTLVLAGARGDGVSQSRARIRELGFVDDPTLEELYRRAAVFAFPSRYEGFGLPVLEAMKFGAPVVASSGSSIPEAGGDAACYVPPEDAAALSTAIARVVDDPAFAATLRERGFARAAAMTWQATAAATLDALEGAAR